MRDEPAAFHQPSTRFRWKRSLSSPVNREPPTSLGTSGNHPTMPLRALFGAALPNKKTFASLTSICAEGSSEKDMARARDGFRPPPEGDTWPTLLMKSSAARVPAPLALFLRPSTAANVPFETTRAG